MPSDKSTERVAAAEEIFRNLVLNQYDLEEDFVSAICGFFRTAAEPLAESSATPKRSRATTGKPKKARKKSAYNVYVREMMKTDDIQKLNHKEKMGAIASCWKELNDDDKTPYTKMANDENAETIAVTEETA
jgi:hypothetical protein